MDKCNEILDKEADAVRCYILLSNNGVEYCKANYCEHIRLKIPYFEIMAKVNRCVLKKQFPHLSYPPRRRWRGFLREGDR